MNSTTIPRPSIRSQLVAPFLLLRGNRNLALLYTAHFTSRLVQWMYLISLFVLAYSISHSASIVALLTFVRLLPNALALPLSGALSDRFDSRRLMTISLGGRALCMLGLLAVHSQGTLWLAFPLLLAATVFSALFRPALTAILPYVVEDRYLFESNSLTTQAEFVTQGMGPALGGLLILVADIHLVFLLAAAVFVMTLGLVAVVRVDRSGSEWGLTAGSVLDQAWDAFRFLGREHEGSLAALAIVLAGIGIVNGANYTLVVVLAERVFHFGGQGADFLNGIYGLGALLGGLAISPLVGRRAITPFFLTMAVVDCLASIAFGFSPEGALPFLFMALGGLTDIATKVSAQSVVQLAAPRILLGRVFAAFESSVLLGQVAGALAVGPLIALQGPRAATFTLAASGVLVVFAMLPWLRRLETTLGVRIFLRQVPALTELAATVIDDLAAHVALEHFEPGTVIVHEGDSGDRFYIVKRGRVHVTAGKEQGSATHVARLSRMDYFGEIALLRDVPRTATVIADGDVELYSLTRDDFSQLVAESQVFRDTLHGVTRARDLDLQNKLLITG